VEVRCVGVVYVMRLMPVWERDVADWLVCYN
jgi:hypothetical protein